MRSFENSVTRKVVDVSTRGYTNTTNGSSKRIRYVISVQVQSCHYRVVFWCQQYLLQEVVGYHVFDDKLIISLRFFHLVIRGLFSFFFLGRFPLLPCIHFITKLIYRQFVAPVFEAPFGEFHDITL